MTPGLVGKFADGATELSRQTLKGSSHGNPLNNTPRDAATADARDFDRGIAQKQSGGMTCPGEYAEWVESSPASTNGGAFDPSCVGVIPTAAIGRKAAKVQGAGSNPAGEAGSPACNPSLRVEQDIPRSPGSIPGLAVCGVHAGLFTDPRKSLSAPQAGSDLTPPSGVQRGYRWLKPCLVSRLVRVTPGEIVGGVSLTPSPVRAASCRAGFYTAVAQRTEHAASIGVDGGSSPSGGIRIARCGSTQGARGLAAPASGRETRHERMTETWLRRARNVNRGGHERFADRGRLNPWVSVVAGLNPVAIHLKQAGPTRGLQPSPLRRRRAAFERSYLMEVLTFFASLAGCTVGAIIGNIIFDRFNK